MFDNVRDFIARKTTTEFADAIMFLIRPIKTIKRVTDPGYGVNQ